MLLKQNLEDEFHHYYRFDCRLPDDFRLFAASHQKLANEISERFVFGHVRHLLRRGFPLADLRYFEPGFADYSQQRGNFCLGLDDIGFKNKAWLILSLRVKITLQMLHGSKTHTEILKALSV